MSTSLSPCSVASCGRSLRHRFCSIVAAVSGSLTTVAAQTATVPVEHHATFAALGARGDAAVAMAVVDALPAESQKVLRALVCFLQRLDPVATRMTPENLGMLISPLLLCRTDETEMIQNMMAVRPRPPPPAPARPLLTG